MGDTIKVTGVSSKQYSGYNTLYRITGITTGDDKDISVVSTTSIDNFSVVGITDAVDESHAYLTGRTITVNSVNYDNTTGFANVVLNSSHGFGVGQKIRMSNADQYVYNGDFVITQVLDDLDIPTYGFVIEIGISDSSPIQTGTIYVHDIGGSQMLEQLIKMMRISLVEW